MVTSPENSVYRVVWDYTVESECLYQTTSKVHTILVLLTHIT